MLVLCCALPAAAAEWVVIQSNIAAYRPGLVVDGSYRFRLTAGEEITLIEKAGSLVQLRGPYDGLAEVSAPRTLSPEYGDSSISATKDLGPSDFQEQRTE